MLVACGRGTALDVPAYIELILPVCVYPVRLCTYLGCSETCLCPVHTFVLFGIRYTEYTYIYKNIQNVYA